MQVPSNRSSMYLGNNKALSTTVFGQKIIVDTKDISLAPHILVDGYWEMWVTKVFRETVRSGMNVIDVGANIGYYSLIAGAQIGDKGRLFAFEANPEVFDTLSLNLEINGFLGRAELVNKAVRDKSGRIRFSKLKKHQGGSSTLEFSKDFLDKIRDDVETIEVETVSLDDYFSGKGIKIDVVKIDAEGSEAYIIDGMRRLINSNPGIVILCEFSPQLISHVKEPRRFLEDFQTDGFVLRFIDEHSNLIETSIEDLLRVESCELYLKR